MAVPPSTRPVSSAFRPSCPAVVGDQNWVKLSFIDHTPTVKAVFQNAGHGFGRFQSIRPKVLAEHAGRGVHGHDDVDALARHVFNAGRTLGPGEHEDDEAESHRPQSIGHQGNPLIAPRRDEVEVAKVNSEGGSHHRLGNPPEAPADHCGAPPKGRRGGPLKAAVQREEDHPHHGPGRPLRGGLLQPGGHPSRRCMLSHSDRNWAGLDRPRATCGAPTPTPRERRADGRRKTDPAWRI